MDRHKHSLDQLVAPDGTGWLSAAVEAVLADAGIAAGEWLAATGWDLVDLDLAWVTHLSCDLSYGTTDLGRLDLRLPWLLDDGARAAAPPDLRVGRHEGLWLGGPRVPLTQLRDAPGVRVRWRSPSAGLDPEDRGGALRPTVVVTPDAGRGLFFNDTGTGRATVRPVWTRTFETLRGVDPDAEWTVTPAGLFSAATLRGVRAALPEVFSPTFDPADQKALTAVVRRLTRDDHAERESRGGTAFADSTKFAPLTASLRPYGDLLGEAVALGVQRNLRTAQWLERSGRKPSSTAWLGPWLGRRTSRRLADVLTGGQAITVADEPENTLSLAETARQVTAFGPFGLRPPVRGSLDFRDLHPGWRGTFCPVHTPESEHISLVRHLALAEVADAAGLPSWRDLSWSAALIPYVNHDEQARAVLAAKNLKQAVPLASPDIPLVRTGFEAVLADRHGVARASIGGTVLRVGRHAVALRTHRHPSGERHPVGPARGEAATGADWLTCVAPGERISSGTVLAHAPDVRLDDDGVPHLALGVDLMVAVTPWHGLNYEDAIVLSRSAAERLRHRERTTFSDDLWPGDWPDLLVDSARSEARLPTVAAGEVLAEIRDASGAPLRRFRAPVAGVLIALAYEPASARVTALVEREVGLEIGDKLTNRHGGKGVVSKIVSDEEMPRLPDGTPVDVIISPAGIVRRLNIGQVHEMAAGLLSHLTDGQPVIAGRQLADRRGLANALANLGAAGGRLPLVDAAGQPLFNARPVLVGPQHFLKLHHLAEKKLSVRADGSVSPVTGQPTRGTTYRDGERIGSGQRLGEMELWALQAMGATRLLADALRDRGGKAGSVRPVLASVIAHLAGTGLLVAPGDQDGPFEPDPTLPDDDLLAQAEAFHVLPSRFRFLKPMTTADFDVHDSEPTPGRPFDLDPEAHPFHSGRFAAPADAYRVTRCFLLPFAYAAGGHLDTAPVRFIAPGETEPTVLRGDRLVALHRLAGRVASVHAWESYVEGGPVRDDVRPLPELWVDVAAQWLPSFLDHEEEVPDTHAIAARMSDPGAPDPAWAVIASALTPVLDCWCNRLPILPSGLRPLGRDRLDVLYLRLAGALDLTRQPLKRPRATSTPRTTPQIEPERALGLVHSIIGTDGDTEAATTSRAAGGRREPRSLLARLTGKSGLLRGALLGTTTFRSGRGVMVPDPARPIGTVGLPKRLHDTLLADADPGDPTGRTVYVVRQPTLRPANLVALTADAVSGSAIHLHPDLCEALAGDFDGDTVAVHRPVSAAARAEALRLFGVAATLRNPASGGYLVKGDLDLALGHHLRAGLAAGVPFTEGLDGLPPEDAIARLGALQHERWEAATGWSLGFVDLPTLAHLSGLDDKALDAALTDALDGTDLGTLHRAGAAGKVAALRQLLVARGVQHGFNTLLDDVDIPDRFIDGLSDEHWFLGARAGAARLAEKKLLTPHAGGFTKLLAEIAYEVKVDTNDCGSAAVPRSPLTCRGEMPCAACVGTLPHGLPATPGMRIGLLAAMLVGERSTQLAMKTFHAGGADTVDLTTLRALFGQGSAPLFASLLESAGLEGEPTLAGWLDAVAPGDEDPDSAAVGRALVPVAEAVAAAFKGAVAQVWVDVLLKQLLEVWLSDSVAGGLARSAKLYGRDPLVVATIHGGAPSGGVPDRLVQQHRVDLLVGKWQR